MCGFIVVAGQGSKDVLQARVARGAASVAERGPDGCRSLAVRGAALLSCRLALWDVGDPRQPHIGAGGCGVLNGELFNVAALAAEGGFDPFLSEVELLTRAVLSRSVHWLNGVDGQFAIAVFSEATQTLILARDRWESRP